MNKLQQLIQQYCPDGVEWKTLRKINGQSADIDVIKKQKSRSKLWIRI